MKSFFLFTFLTIAVAIACTPNKSAGSPSVQNNNEAAAQTSPQNESAPTQDKPKCSLTLASIGPLYGLKPRMTTDEVLALFPGAREDTAVSSTLVGPPNVFGTSSFVIRPAKYEKKGTFSGINLITFNVFDGRVSNFTIGYDGPEYAHVDKFVSKLVEGTSLPAADQWEAYVGMDTQLKTLTCEDFVVRVFAGGQGGNLNYVEIRDLEAAKKLKERRAKATAAPKPTP